MTPRLSVWAFAALASIPWSPAHAQEEPRGKRTFEMARAELESGDAWRAQDLFGRAIREGYPEAEGYRALADAYLALDNRLFNAREALEHALAADSTNVENWYLLADVNLRLGGLDAENGARRALLAVMRLDPDHAEAYDRWRRLYLDREDAGRVAEVLDLHLDRDYRSDIALRRIDVLHDAGRYEEALGELERLERAQPGSARSPEWSYYMAVTLAALGREQEGWERYVAGIRAARDPAELRPYFTDVELLLPQADHDAWAGWSLAAQRTYLEGWWNRRDPLPLTEINERWTEQQSRIRYVRHNFQYKKAFSIERMTSMEHEDSGHGKLGFRLDGRPLDDRAGFYLRHGPADFKGGVGESECGFWYFRREGLPKGESFAINFRTSPIGNDCLYSPAPTTEMGLGHFAPGELTPWSMARVRQRVEADFTLALGSDSYPFDLPDRIPLDLAPANFSQAGGPTELSLFFAIPIDAVGGDTGETRYRKGLVLYDGNWNEITRRTEEMEYRFPHARSGGKEVAFLVDLFRLQIQPGEYQAAIQIDDRNGEGIGVWKGPVTVRAFSRDRLEISDLLFAARVESGGLPRFTRYGHAVLPLPSRTILRGQTFFLYYEIYNLARGAEGRSRFRIEYEIRSVELDRGVVRRAFEGLKGLVGVRDEPDAVVTAFERAEVVEGRTWPEALSFDTVKLPAGTYRIEVSVVDQLAGDVTARQAVEFAIVDG